jgi:hypothetical protein
MSNYESDPAGLGVGKRYGPLGLGGVQGAHKTYGAYSEAIFEISFEELTASAAQVVKLPAYAEVVEVTAEVKEVFGTGDTLDVTLDGTSVLGVTKVDCATVGPQGPVTLSATAADLQVGATAEDLAIDVTLVDAGTPETGYVKVAVKYRNL